MRQTEHYGLNLWDLSDRIQMEDFNGDNQKLDAALAALAAGGSRIEQLGKTIGSANPQWAMMRYIWTPYQEARWDECSIMLITGNTTQPESGTTPFVGLANSPSSEEKDQFVQFKFQPGGYLCMLFPFRDGTRNLEGLFIGGGTICSFYENVCFNDVRYFVNGGRIASGECGSVLMRNMRFIAIR